MKLFVLFLMAILLVSCNPVRDGSGLVSNAVFGEDDREDVYDAERKHRKWARSTAGMFSNIDIKKALKGEALSPLSEHGVAIFIPGAFFPTMGKVCPEMKFADQAIGAQCSGFLVGKDLLVTAGHCVTSQSDCEKTSWVFDYKMKKNGKLNLKWYNVYGCKELVSQRLTNAEATYDPEEYAAYEKCMDNHGGFSYSGSHDHCQRPEPVTWDYSNQADFALIRLERKAWFRKPFKVRTEGEVEAGEEVTVIGHPLGLPSKVTTGGEVIGESYTHSFSINTDAFKGNSGSGVINERTGEIEGILVRGWDPFILDEKRNCYKINPVDEMGTEIPYNEDYELSRKDLLTGVNKITSIQVLMDLLKK